MLEIKKAVRRALPLQVAFYGPTGSGKTWDALMFGAGLANGGSVVVIDTERGRASLYADNKKILAALPDSFSVVELDPPYHPSRYIEAINLVEQQGFKVCIIDSLSDAWDGPGGCVSIAEEAKNMWNGAKLWNKRMMSRIVLSDMHVICLFKAQEKTKIIDKSRSASGKQEYVDLGMLPIAEKTNFYPMLLGFQIDPKTHLATVTKCHDDLAELFREPKLITKADGDRVRLWNESGASVEATTQLKRRAQEAANNGTNEYTTFFGGLSKAQKKILVDTTHAENKRIAEEADRQGSADEMTPELNAELNRQAEAEQQNSNDSQKGKE